MTYNENKLRELLILAQTGDKESYRKFLEMVLPYISSMASKKVFEKNDVSDVIQEILMSIHKSLGTYDSKRAVMPWLTTISQRRIIDYIRKVSKRPELEGLTKDGDVTFLKDETKVSLDTSEVLKHLPEDTQKAITLTKIEGHSTKEAADILGIKENALRTKISRGMTLLKKKAKEGVIDE